MKRTLIIGILLIANILIANPSINLVSALIEVESNGNSNAIGDNGNAIGCLQIWKVVVDDINRIYKTNFKYSDRTNRIKSVYMCIEYLTYWGKVYHRKTNLEPNNEVYSRIWNGGPYGYKKECTKKYWNKVKLILNKKGD